MSAVMDKGTSQLVMSGSWQVGTGQPGAPGMRLDLTLVSTPPTSVNGHSRISQAVNPPVDVVSTVSGSFTPLVGRNGTTTVVTLQGYPIFHWSPRLGIGPVIPPNLEVHMIMEPSWREGTATYRYTTEPGGEWYTVDSVPVTYLGQPASLD